MAKLGFWNRLAFVITVLATVLSPIIGTVMVRYDYYELSKTFYDYCRKSLPDIASPLYDAQSKQCWDEYVKPYDGPGWDFIWSVGWGALAICAIVYVLIWAITATCRWVWAGRKK